MLCTTFTGGVFFTSLRSEGTLPLTLSWGCTKFYQGRVPTLIRLGKVKEKGHIGQSRHS